jgi:chemotaxis signal transduction protein
MNPGSETTDLDEWASKRLHVRAGDRRIAIPIEVVSEVGTPSPAVEVPHGAEWLHGLVQWRGRLLTLVDAGLLFGLRRSRAAKLVVMRNLNVETALAVDRIIGTEFDDESAEIVLDVDRLRSHAAFQPGAAVTLDTAPEHG